MARNQHRTNNRIVKSTYISGSAAPKLQPVPTIVPEIERKQHDERREQHRREQIKRQQRINHVSHKNLLYTLTVTGIVMVIFLVCWQYLHLQAEVKAASTEVSKLQSQFNELKLENDEMEVSINANIDYDNIYRIATEELGMIFPKRSQVINYDAGVSEYVKQYQDIPSAK